MDTTRPKDFVFVLMPFSDDFDDVYKLGIKEACREAGVYCERVDEQIYSENMLDRIYNQISKADFLIADMSDKNPNVFYEVGYAHALGKNVILITKRSEDIPFDLRHYSHIVYNGKVAYLKEQLVLKIRYFSEHRMDNKELLCFPLKLFMDGFDLSENGITFPLYDKTLIGNPFKITIFNDSNIIYDKKFKVSLVADSNDFEAIIITASKLLYKEISFAKVGGNIMQIVEIASPLYPKEPICVKFILGDLEREFSNYSLRVLTDSGVIEYPLCIKLIQESPF